MVIWHVFDIAGKKVELHERIMSKPGWMIMKYMVYYPKDCPGKKSDTNMKTPFLRVQRGDPYTPHHQIELPLETALLGRPHQDFYPDLPFSDPHISRRHAIISSALGIFTLTDLSSKHGTSLNNLDLLPGHSYTLHHGDVLSLAKGIVLLTFLQPGNDAGMTTDLSHPLEPINSTKDGPISIDVERRQVLLAGTPLLLQGKELELLIALYSNEARAICYDDIRRLVWPERPEGIIPGVPDVETSEITTLVYRLRQKLGCYSDLIITVPRYGYRLNRQ